MNDTTAEAPRAVSREQWLEARIQLLAQEKELTKARDRLAAARRQLPWVKLDKDYLFDAPEGKRSLAQLFDGRSQLFVRHFMFGPDWEAGCIGCSFASDHVDGMLPHLAARDVSYLAVSRAPLAKIEAFKRRMGWRFRWVSSGDSDFNYDFNVSFGPRNTRDGKGFYNYAWNELEPGEESGGVSVFCRNAAGEIFHTYSSFARGDEMLDTTYMVLDLTPKGRAETGPHFNLVDWVKHHDRYGVQPR